MGIFNGYFVDKLIYEGGIVLNIAIIEDDLQELENLKDCLNKYFCKREIIYNVEVFSNPDDLIRCIDKFDLVFLDIQLSSKQNGIEIGISIRKKNRDIKIIFVTNYSEYLIEGYKANADRYFIKPIKQKQFEIEIDNVIEDYLSRFAGFVDYKICNRKLYYQEISYIEFSKRKTYLHLVKGDILETPYSLKYWIEKVKSLSFSQPYKSIIVNLNQISGFSADGKDIILLNDKLLPLSKHFKKSFDQEYLHNIHKRM